MDKLAIVILNWNGRHMLEKYLPSVMKYSQDEATVYVADNASTDDSLDFLHNNFKEVKTIALDRNYGFAGGYNMALRQVEAQYYVLLNSDVEVTSNWLPPLITFMDSHDDVAACQPKLLSVVDRTKFEYAGAAGGFIDKYGYPFCRGRLFETVEADNGQYDTDEDLLWATGACLVVRADDYHKQGGLDERFFAHNEEIDFCWRLRLMGRRICCVSASVVYHLGGGTLPKGNSRKTYLNFRNNLTMLYKCLPDDELRHVMRVRWWLDRLAAWQTLILNGNYADFKAIYRARRDFKRWLSDFRADRQRLQESRVVERVAERKQFSLLWQYYAKGHKLFSRLPNKTEGASN